MTVPAWFPDSFAESFVVVQAAFANDPIVVSTAGLASLVVLVSVPLRRGGVDARVVIDVFAYLATIASSLKALVWVAKLVGGRDAVAPTGTDALLVMGAFGAVLTVSLQGLWSSVEGKADSPRPVASLLTKLRGWLPDQFLQKSGRKIEEKPDAAKGELVAAEGTESTLAAVPSNTEAAIGGEAAGQSQGRAMGSEPEGG